MNNILDYLFIKKNQEQVIKQHLLQKIKERYPDIKVKDIQEYVKNQEVSQINTTVNKTN